MQRKHGLCLLVFAGSLLARGVWAQASTHDRIIGAVAPNGGAYLVKHFSLPTGAVLYGAEFSSNDPQTVFPKVSILRGPVTRLSEAAILAQASEVRSIGGRRMQIVFPPIAIDTPQDIYVAVGLPPTDGIRGFGDGAGVLAKQLDAPGNSYFVMAEDGYLGRMDVEYEMGLLVQGLGKARAEDLEPKASSRRASLSAVPNPFNPAVTIRLEVPRPGPVRVAVYDVMGRRIRTLVNQSLPAGVREVVWDGRDDLGQPRGAGVYLIKLLLGSESLQEKVVLIK